MIVVAIVAIGALVAVLSINASRERITIDRATADIRGVIEHARSIASVAGSRSVDGRIVGAGCGANPLAVVINAGAAATVQYPFAVGNVDPNTGAMTIQCATWPPPPAANLADVVQRGSGAVLNVTGPTTFSFTPSGRTVGFGAAASVLVRITSPSQQTVNGFRLLPSGVICESSDPAPAAGQECDESARF